MRRFIARWAPAEAAERASYQAFLTELAQVLDLPAVLSEGMPGADAYRFEKAVRVHSTDGGITTRRIDLYRRDTFILEAKQGASARAADSPDAGSTPGHPPQSDLFGDTVSARARRKRNVAPRGTPAWERAMHAAFMQASAYAHHLPEDEGWPPLLIVADIGYCFDLYANFSRNGRAYAPFPAAGRNRIHLTDLLDPAPRERLRLAWTNPDGLDPARRTEKVTREVSARLADLARSLEAAGHAPEAVAAFLMRGLFTLFAEDTGLLPEASVTTLLRSHRDAPDTLVHMLAALWRDMDTGAAFSAAIGATVRRFNGHLFRDQTPLPLTRDQIDLLIEAAAADWQDVEPAIFGTLLERALDPRERHRLGAYYTPRAYVERLVAATVMEPLRDEWDTVKAAAERAALADRPDEALAEIQAFHAHLCAVNVLDPACGTGNFLYVALDLMKRLEDEVCAAAATYGERQWSLRAHGLEVSPQQFRGLEVNPRAAAIADMVLWIGYLQWHRRAFGRANPPDPVLHDYGNIRCRDALLVWRDRRPRIDAAGRPVTRWDRRSYRIDPASGHRVPDETQRIGDHVYVQPGPAPWPPADFIVGNPPFQGGKDLRDELGDGYAEALWAVYGKALPNAADLVMYWWHRAAELTRAGKVRRFGFITTNSMSQTYNRRVVERHVGHRQPLSLVYAIPDHPWVDAGEGAAVRIAMTVGEAGDRPGRLLTVTGSASRGKAGLGHLVSLSQRTGKIWSNLRLGPNLTLARPLRANAALCSPGVKLHGSGFIVSPEHARTLGLGTRPGVETVIHPYLNGRDLMQRTRGRMVIDLFGQDAEAVRDRHPEIYQHLLETVKPERDQNNRATYRDTWWIFGEPRTDLRRALDGLPRYIATVETAKHRVFVFLDARVRPDNKLVAIGHDDAYVLGVLSSRLHVAWALAAGGRLGFGNDPVYVKSHCFDRFPFPAATEAQAARIRALAEHLDALRKDRQAAHPDLTLTGLYNVLEALRAGRPLTEAEQAVKDTGTVQVLREIHDDLDGAVAEAYGWPAGLDDEAMLGRLVDLNRDRVAEEAKGRVRWLRPTFQHPTGATLAATEAAAELDLGPTERAAPRPWPKPTRARIAAVRQVLGTAGGPVSVDQIAGTFRRARRRDVEDLVETLVDMGLVRASPDRRRFEPLATRG
ncbi:class I SAM-dependent DNA methyltransferase [Roseospira navarrensis]|uniref:site-specific DNA-methyltransferase (adenine-specific) n=1 Tax=Roseospira navarrensis TaxID=140058 RepID=A0A7X1ZG92_9PROT|nr:class I SAM-dependent DNA methyltransferase [Roseospira navarrensis]